VDVDPLNPSADEELVGLDAAGEDVGSITRFLTLPTDAARSCARMRDPIMDFSKSIMLTSECGSPFFRQNTEIRKYGFKFRILPC